MVALAAALVAGGCGSSEADSAAVRKVVTEYLAAFERADGRAACALMLPEVQRSLGTDCAATVEDRVKRLTPEERAETRALRVDNVVTQGDNARARLYPGDAQVALRKRDGEWRIAGVP